MKKYYIGLIIIGLLIAGLTGFTLFQAAGARQDNETQRKAQEIAKKLNKYVQKNGPPENLEEADIHDVPSTITYSRKDSNRYEFCVNYKNAGSSYDSVSLGEVLFSGMTEPRGGMSYDDYYESDYESSSLYLSYRHKAGDNCQTVKTYNYYNDYDKPFSPPSSSGYDTKATSSSAEDTERQTDIKALHAQLEAYYAMKGTYPTLANLNDSTWRATNMKGLDKEALRDPKGTGYTLGASATKNAYSYSVLSDTGKPCDNSAGNACAFYTLQATLSKGTSYSKHSLN